MQRRTKIVATWGPAVSSDEQLTLLLQAGVDVFRLNFSHATHEEIADVVPRIRRLAQAARREVALLQDIQGPRIRTGEIANGGHVELATGSIVTVGNEHEVTTPEHIQVSFPRFAEDVQPGHRILIADGTLVLRALDCNSTVVRAQVLHGGILGEHKGVNLPDSHVSAEPLTDKDVDDLRFGAEMDMDFVALSFVRHASDVEACREVLSGLGRETTPIISKIEHPQAITNIEEILQVSDGIMVARGDLGVEVSPERVPLLQKRIIHRSNEVGIPVITATQMLESMIDRPTPTRAEASDIANAILDGTDAVMLSGETAVGRFPVQAVETMARIAVEAESAEGAAGRFHRSEQPYLVAQSAVQLAKGLNAKAIIVYTRGGHTARTLALYRPERPIFALTPNPDVARRLTLHFAVYPIVSEDLVHVDDMLEHGTEALLDRGVVGPGDVVVLIGSSPIGPPNLINVRVVE